MIVLLLLMYRFSFLILGLIVGGVLMSNLHLVSAQFIDDFIDSFDLATDPDNGECLTTDGTNNVWSSSCGGGGGTPGGSNTQVQFNNSGSFAGDSGFTYSSSTDILSVVSINATNSTTTHLAVTGTGTSTFAGGINTGTNHIVTHGVQSDASDGLHIHAGNGTNVGLFGAGNTANSLFYGGVNIDGATRLATSLTGFLKATAGAVSTSTVSLLTDISGVLGIANGGTATSTQTTNGVNYYNGTSITSGTGFTFNGTDTVTVNGATTNAALNVKALASSNQAMQTQMTNTTDIAFSTYNTGDSFTRFSFLADGTMKWGGGVLAGDVGLNRSASGTLSLMPYGSASTGYLGIGTTTPTTPLSVVGDSLVTATSTVQSKLFVGTRGTNTTFGPWSGGTGFGNFVSSCDGCGATGGNLLAIANFGGGTAGINTFSARGTTASPTATQSGDDIYFMGGRGHGSTTWANGSKVAINMEASQTWTDSAQGTQLSLETTPNNSTTRAVRVQVTNDGNVGISTTTPVGKLTVVGTSGGSILQLLSDTGTKFMELLNTGVLTLLGAIDAGGATSFEIPNGTAPTINATGTIALDTTDNQLVVGTSTTGAVVRLIDRIGGFSISSTTYPYVSGFTSGVAIPFVMERDGYVVTEIHCDIDGGTSIVVNFDNGSGNTSTVTCDTDGASVTGLNSNNVVTAGSVSASIETGTVTGSPDRLRVSVFGYWVRE